VGGDAEEAGVVLGSWPVCLAEGRSQDQRRVNGCLRPCQSCMRASEEVAPGRGSACMLRWMPNRWIASPEAGVVNWLPWRVIGNLGDPQSRIAGLKESR
jgi:hypothetical protein